MRAPLKAKLGMTFTAAPSAIGTPGRESRHFTVALETPRELNGKGFSFMVAPFIVTGDSTLRKLGRESFARPKRKPLTFQPAFLQPVNNSREKLVATIRRGRIVGIVAGVNKQP